MMTRTTRQRYRMSVLRLSALAAASLALSGCLSLGVEPPESLLTLNSTTTAPAGTGATAGGEDAAGAIAVLTPETPAKLDVLRVPVAVSDTEIAYLQETFWVEKPARLFRRLLGETLRAKTGALVIDSDDTPLSPSIVLRGTLIEMGYDAGTSAVVVRYDAIRNNEDGTTVSRRFEARETGVLPEAAFVGPAINRAANQVAGEVADWIVEGP